MVRGYSSTKGLRQMLPQPFKCPLNLNTLLYSFIYQHLTNNWYLFIVHLPSQGLCVLFTALSLAPTQGLALDTQISLGTQEVFVE